MIDGKLRKLSDNDGIKFIQTKSITKQSSFLNNSKQFMVKLKSHNIRQNQEFLEKYFKVKSMDQ